MESRATSYVTREQFDNFCREGRLAGSDCNRRAGVALKEHLERAGFTPFESPILLDRRRLLIVAALLVALAVRQRNPLLIVIFLLGAGLTFRVWQGMRTGTPVAVYGVRKDPELLGAPSNGVEIGADGAGCETRPTLVLCAHYDTASAPFPFSGSPVRTVISMVAVMAAASLLYTAVHPVAGLVAGGLVLGALCLTFFAGNRSPGADDNASGVFAVLECLRRFGHQNGVNIVPVFFNFEEQGLLGSRAWVRRYVGRKGQGIRGVEIDRKKAYAINFDCVGRGRRVFISGNRCLRERLLATAAARSLKATRTWLYPSDHLAFRSPWKAVSFARANRFWALDLGWVHSRRDVPTAIRLDYLAELSGVVEEFVLDLAAHRASALAGR